MKFKNARTGADFVPLDNQAKFIEAFHEAVEQNREVFGVTNDFTKKLFCLELSRFAKKSGVALEKDSPALEALAECFSKHAPTVYSKIAKGLSKAFGQPVVSVGAHFYGITGARGETIPASILIVSYRFGECDAIFKIDEYYCQYGRPSSNLGSMVQKQLEQKAIDSPCELVAVSIDYTETIDTLEGLIKEIAGELDMVVLTAPTGTPNLPTIQGMRSVDTTGGLVVQKLALAFSPEFAELISTAPVNNVALLKGV